MALDQSLERLLEPSLGPAATPQRLFSLRAGFFVAFFGGVFGAAAFGLLNAWKARRLAKDAAFFAALFVLAAVFVVAKTKLWASGPPAWLLSIDKQGQLTLRLGGLALYGLVFLRHRLLHAVNDLRGARPLSPWFFGISCAVLGNVAVILITMALR